MQSQFNFGVTGCNLSSLDSCLALEINDISTLDNSPFEMAGGQLLRVGDRFIGIDKSGSAGNPPVKITDGWYQQYEGAIYVAADAAAWISDDDRKILLFNAYKVDTGESALEGFKSEYRHQFMAYINHSGGRMMYWNSCGSSRVVKCESINRFTLPKNK